MSEARKRETVAEARRLLRGARVGTLATSASGGQPFASMVTPACAPDLSVLLLLSNLSEHTRHLRADPRCALLVAGPPETANPQTAPRLTVMGEALRTDDRELKGRWLALHPYAASYAGFADFGLWRVRLEGGLSVGGFAKATKLPAALLLPDPGPVETIAAAEASIIAHFNDNHADALGLIAEAHGGPPGTWRLVAVDLDGCDLGQGERVQRIAWTGSVGTSSDVRNEIVALAAMAATDGH